MRYFITAIDTDSGKTIISTLVSLALNADYWKPIQSGLEIRDSNTIAELTEGKIKIHPEKWVLTQPMSPHAAAKIDEVKVDLEGVEAPQVEGDLVIEGAGGLLVPINDQDVIADIIEKVADEVIVVSNLYLGSINHTLLTASELKRRGIPVKGIIFNGEINQDSIDIILKKTGYKKLLHMPQLEEINLSTIQPYIEELRKVL